MKLDNINYGTHLSGLDVAQKYIFTCAIHKIPKENGMNGWKISIFSIYFYVHLRRNIYCMKIHKLNI